MSDHDDELRRALAAAHRGETTTPFAALLERRPRRRPRLLMPLAFAGALVAALLVWPHAPSPPPPPPIELSSLQLSSRGPLDFLLTMPGDALLAQTPRFDAKGDWP
jgi:hypothetical protein